MLNKCLSSCKSFYNRCNAAFSTDVQNLHPAELMKRFDRNMYVCAAVAVLFTAFLAMNIALGNNGALDVIALTGMTAGSALTGYSFLQRCNVKKWIDDNHFDLNGLDTHYHYGDIKKDLGILFLGKHAVVPIILPHLAQTEMQN